MIHGASSDVPDATMVPTRAATTRPRCPAITGARRFNATPTAALRSAPCVVLSLYGFIMAGAPLRVVDLNVFGTAGHQLAVRAGGQDFRFHQQHDLVVVFHRR